MPVELSVRVNYANNNEPAPAQTRVQLVSATANLVAEGFTDSRGEVRFPSVVSGTYRVAVSGVDIEDVKSDPFTIFPNQGSALQFVAVRSRADAAAKPSSPEGSVSAFMLSIPKPAQKSFDEAVKLYHKHKVDQASEKFEDAIHQYPHYAAAHEYLGVMEAEAGNMKKAQAHFLDATIADPQFVPAYFHLAKMHIQEKDFKGAEDYLGRGLKLQPRSTEGLFLLVYVQMSENRFDDVIATTARLHQLPHEQFAAAHIAAGSAFAHKDMKKESREQYELYLKESPTGPSAQLAKNAIASMQERAKE